jgi:hypothetical protein
MEDALQSHHISVAGLFVAGLILAACATTSTTPSGEASVPEAAPAASTPAAPSVSVAERDLTPAEKKIIVDVLAPNLKNPGAAKYRWTKFPTVPASDQVAYCATVDAESPHAAFSGRQAYIVDVKVAGGHIASAVVGLIVGGKDTAIVAKMCKEHGLDPFKAT